MLYTYEGDKSLRYAISRKMDQEFIETFKLGFSPKNNALYRYLKSLGFSDEVLKEIENAFNPTLEDIKNDPEFYAELVNDLMFHWMYGTKETPLMNLAKRNYKIGVEGKVI